MFPPRDHIIWLFTHQSNIQTAIYNYINDIPRSSSPVHSNTPGDPTASAALRAISIPAVDVEYGGATFGKRRIYHLPDPQLWLRVITLTDAAYAGTKYTDLIRLHFRIRASRSRIHRELHISPSTVTSMINSVIERAIGIAIGLGLEFLP